MKYNVWLDTRYPNDEELVAYLAAKNIAAVQTSSANGHPVFKYTGNREQLVELIDLFWYDPDLYTNIEVAKTTIEVLVEDSVADTRMELSIEIPCNTGWLVEITLLPACILAEEDEDGNWTDIQLYYDSVTEFKHWFRGYF